MEKLLILNGLREWKKYTRHINILNRRHGLKIKEMFKQTKDGQKGYTYYYWSKPRNPNDPNNKKYRDECLGSTKFDIDKLAPIVAKNELDEFKERTTKIGAEGFIVSKDDFIKMKQVAPGFFHEGDIEIIYLDKALENFEKKHQINV